MNSKTLYLIQYVRSKHIIRELYETAIHLNQSIVKEVAKHDTLIQNWNDVYPIAYGEIEIVSVRSMYLYQMRITETGFSEL